MAVTRRKFLGSAMAALPVGHSVLMGVPEFGTIPTSPPPVIGPRCGTVYLYGSVEIAYPVVIAAKSLTEVLDIEWQGLSRDFAAAVGKYEHNGWMPDPELLPICAANPYLKFAPFTSDFTNVPERHHDIVCFHTAHGLMELDGQIWRRMENRDVYRAIIFIYGITSEQPIKKRVTGSEFWVTQARTYDRLMDLLPRAQVDLARRAEKAITG